MDWFVVVIHWLHVVLGIVWFRTVLDPGALRPVASDGGVTSLGSGPHPEHDDEFGRARRTLDQRRPHRIRQAQCAGIRARMTGEWRVLPERSDEILDAWEAEAAIRRLEPYGADAGERDAWLRERVGRSGE